MKTVVGDVAVHLKRQKIRRLVRFVTYCFITIVPAAFYCVLSVFAYHETCYFLKNGMTCRFKCHFKVKRSKIKSRLYIKLRDKMRRNW